MNKVKHLCNGLVGLAQLFFHRELFSRSDSRLLLVKVNDLSFFALKKLIFLKEQLSPDVFFSVKCN